MQRMRAISIGYYVAVVAFHWLVFFTGVGNYFHGGTPFEWFALEVLAIAIVGVAIWLTPRNRGVARGIVVLCCVMPVLSVAWSLIAAMTR